MKPLHLLASTILVLGTLNLMSQQTPQKAVIDGPYTPKKFEDFPLVEQSFEGDITKREQEENRKLVDPKTGKLPPKIEKRSLKYVLSKKSGLQKREASSIRQNGAEWLNRGPFNVGGRTRALVIDVTNENIILAGGVSGGIWRSTNGGASWTKTSSSTDLHIITSIAQDPRSGKQNIWYATTGELIGSLASGGKAFYSGNGIYKSVNGGLSWSLIPSTTSNTPQFFDSFWDANWRVCVNPLNGDVYVASFGNIYRSTDEGNSWRSVLRSPDAAYTDVICTNEGILYATLSSQGDPQNTIKGIFRSVNGTNWVNITPDDFPSEFFRIVMDFSRSNPDFLFFIGNTPGSGKLDHSMYKYVYKAGIGNGEGSQGNGGTWTNLSENIPSLGGLVPSNSSLGIGDFNSHFSYNLVIAIHPTDTNTIFLGGTNLFRSSNGFTNEESTQIIGGFDTRLQNATFYPNSHPDMHSIVFYPSNPSRMLTAHDGGISSTNNNKANFPGNNPVSWLSLNNGYLTTQAFAIAIDESKEDDPLILAGFQDNGTWATSGTLSNSFWINRRLADGGYPAIADGGLTQYYSSQLGNILRFGYNQQGIRQYWTNITPDLIDPLFITPYALDPNNQEIMFLLDNNKIWRNSNLAGIPRFSNQLATQNWVLLDRTEVPDGITTALDVSTNIAHRLIYGSSEGKVFLLDQANEGNNSPLDISGENFPEGGYVSSIKIDPLDADRIFVAFSNYNIPSLFLTDNGGDSWSDVSGNLEQNPDGSGNGPSVAWIEILQLGNDPIYFAGTSTGLYSTQVLEGENTQWTQEGAETIGNVIVKMIKTRDDGTVAIGTHGNGIYSTKIEIQAPQVDFSANILTATVGEEINFSDLSENFPNSWEWSFPGSETPSSNSRDPQGIIYNQPGCYEVSLKVSNEAGSQTISRACFINVLPAAYDNCTCDTLTNISSSESIANYFYRNNQGYFAGHNAFGHTFFAEKFSVADSGEINAFRIRTFKAKDGQTEGTISFNVWTDNDGLPASLIYSENYPLSHFDTTQINTRSISETVKVGGTFHIGIGINYGTGDTLALSSTFTRGANGLNTSSVFTPNGWQSIPDLLNSEEFNISLLLSPVFCRSELSSTIDAISCKEFLAPDGNLYTEPGEYVAFIQNAEGCDSTVYINLQSLDSVDTNVLLLNNSLLARAQNANFRWLDCNNGLTAIEGATDSVFIPELNGSYSLEVEQNGCVDTSECISFTTTGILDNALSPDLQVFPNPTKNKISIHLGELFSQVKARVYNLNGQIIHTETHKWVSEFSLDLQGAPGLYIIELTDFNGANAKVKVLKQP